MVVVSALVAVLLFWFASDLFKPRPFADHWPYSEHWWPGMQCGAHDDDPGYDDPGCPSRTPQGQRRGN